MKTTRKNFLSQIASPITAPRHVIELSSFTSTTQNDFGRDSDVEIVDEDFNYPNSNSRVSRKMKSQKTVDNIVRKPNKSFFKCKVCKKVNADLDIKQCDQCTLLFHPICMQMKQKENSKALVCIQCIPIVTSCFSVAKNNTLIKSNNKIRKENNQEKQYCHKVKKVIVSGDKTQQNNSNSTINKQLLKQFIQQYPYYFRNSKICFPIHDKLFLDYKELFKKLFVELLPLQQHQIIPSYLLGDILTIQNYCFSLQNDTDYRIIYCTQTLFNQFKSKTDRCFNGILLSVLWMYLSDVLIRNKSENIKFVNESKFFKMIQFLRKMLTENEFRLIIIKLWKPTIQNLKLIPSLLKSFEFMSTTDLNINTVQNKIYILSQLILGLSESDTFHDIISKKTERKQQIVKQKQVLDSELKKIQIKIANRQNILKGKKYNNNLSQKIIRISCQKSKQKLKEIHEDIQNNKGAIQMQLKELKQNAIQLKQKINDMSKDTSKEYYEIELLGIDRNKSQYYFLQKYPNTLFVNCQVEKFTKCCYKIIKGLLNIHNYIENLNPNGINQKQLSSKIKNKIDTKIIRDIDNVSLFQTFPSQLDFLKPDALEINIQNIAKNILEYQTRYSQFLHNKGYMWINEVKQKSLRTVIQNKNGDINVLRDSIKYMQQKFVSVECLQNKSEQETAKKKKKRIVLWLKFTKIRLLWLEQIEQINNKESLLLCFTIFKSVITNYIQDKQHKTEIQEKRLQKQIENLCNSNVLDASVDCSNDQISKQLDKPITINLKKKSQFKNILLETEKSQNYQIQQQIEAQTHVGCHICGQHGQLLCCDNCPKLYHIQCVNLKKVPSGQWKCFECISSSNNVRNTRKAVQKLFIE